MLIPKGSNMGGVAVEQCIKEGQRACLRTGIPSGDD
jgi:hypothetical protein